MNRRQADRVVGLLLGVVLLVGLVSTGQLLVSDDSMMGHAGAAPAIHFLGPLLLSVLVVAVVAGAYALVRDGVFDGDPPREQPATTPTDVESSASAAGNAADPAADTDGHPDAPDDADSAATITRAERRVLDLLPEDERRVLTPVIESPGITQTAVADRADYSRSKVSQTVTDLEDRGLLYRERQGRTYRVYPADDLGDRH